MNRCSLCALVAAAAEHPLLIGAFDRAVAVLHDDWAVRGHAMIVAKRHVENVSELDREEAAAFFDTFRLVEAALLEVFAAERVFVMKLGVAVPHLHFHLYPVSAAATRDDFLAAVTMQSRDEPPPAEQRAIIARLRDLTRRAS